jgi:general secretion pathway protein D
MRKLMFMVLFVVGLMAQNMCNNKLFTYSNSINPQSRLTIEQFLNLLVTQKCNIYIVYNDTESRNLVKDKMPFFKG